MDTNTDNNEKVKIYINVEPLGVKFGTVFKKSETFQSIANFILAQVKKLGIKFELGRITEDKTNAIILTDNLIGDFLENNDQVTVYSDEYSFIKSNLPGDVDHNSSKKIFFQRNVSDLYKSKNFLKKKRHDKPKNLKNVAKKDDKKENESEEENEEKEKDKKNAEQKKNENKEKDKKVNNKNKKEETKKKNENKNSKTEKKNEKNKTTTTPKTSEKKEKRRNDSSSESEEENNDNK